MFWKIAKVMGDLSSIHLFSAEPITRILVVSFFPFLSVVGCVSRRRRISSDLLIVKSVDLCDFIDPKPIQCVETQSYFRSSAGTKG